MSPLEAGPWVLIMVGAISSIVAIYKTGFGTAKVTGLWLLWVFGFGMIGVGIWGPGFFSPYADFLKTITAMQRDPSPQSYQNALEKVASGTLQGAYRDIVLQYAVNQPVEGTDTLLAGSIAKASSEDSRKALISAQSELHQKKEVADRLVQSLTKESDPEKIIDQFDPSTRAIVARSLLQKPPTDTLRKRINPTVLERWRVPIWSYPR